MQCNLRFSCNAMRRIHNTLPRHVFAESVVFAAREVSVKTSMEFLAKSSCTVLYSAPQHLVSISEAKDLARSPII